MEEGLSPSPLLHERQTFHILSEPIVLPQHSPVVCWWSGEKASSRSMQLKKEPIDDLLLTRARSVMMAEEEVVEENERDISVVSRTAVISSNIHLPRHMP